ncbi:MAG: T9SS type A sorting domain-containing protein [Chlorobi bacterium]|nr:T9SS type A sorting domain-containing protein [Chlorobiota bacterium]
MKIEFANHFCNKKNVRRIKIFIIVLFISIIPIGMFAQINAPGSVSSFDYSNLSWTDAFDSLHACLSLRYPFTDLKAVDWPEKKTVAEILINKDQINNDTISFISHLFEYLYQIPDGHIELVGNIDSFKQSMIAGTYGFNMIPVDDGSVVVSLLPEESPAYDAGLRTGDKIQTWNGINIDSVGSREYLNYFRNYATAGGRMFSRYLMLSRDSINATAEISFISNKTKAISTINLTAFDDSMQMYMMGLFNTAQPPNMDSLVYYETLENNVGYLYIGAEASQGMTPEEIMQSPDFIMVQEAISYFNENNIDKLIVDLRFNLGGNDLQAAVMMGLFYENSSFYENITSTCDNDYEVVYSLFTEPLTPKYNGEIAVIVDPNCISTGEGLAMMFQRLNNAQIVSHWGTNASFGIVDFEPVLLPEGLAVTFPQARSLDENLNIQLDSDSSMIGGVQPDIHVPLDIQSVIQQYELGVDVQLNYAKSLLLGIDKNIVADDCILFPNPCVDKINIKLLNNTSDGIYNLRIYNLQGQLVSSDNLLFATENEIKTLNLRTLKSGVYSYSLSNGSYNHKGKFIIRP